MQSDKLSVIYTISSKSSISKNIGSPQITKELRWILQELGVVGCGGLSNNKENFKGKDLKPPGIDNKIPHRNIIVTASK